MFKAIVKRLGELWNGTDEQQQTEIALSKETVKREDTLYKLNNLNHLIPMLAKWNPKNIVVITIPIWVTDNIHSLQAYYFYVDSNDKIQQLFPYNFLSKKGSVNLDVKPFDNTAFFDSSIKPSFDYLCSKKLNIEDVRFKVLELGVDIPLTAKKEMTKLFKAHKPGIWGHLFGGKYLCAIDGDQIHFTDENGLNQTVITDWQLDLVRYLEIHNLPTVTYSPYVVYDYDLVDRKLIPQTDYRRWMEVTELEGSDSDWVLRITPTGIAAGKIRYFSLNFVFDRILLAGVAFDSLSMIKDAVRTTNTKCAKELDIPAFKPSAGEGVLNYDFEPATRVTLNLANINVSHDQLKMTYIGYLMHQAKHDTFKDTRPYLIPYSRKIKVGDQTIGFNSAGKLVNYFEHECNGDSAPNDKRPYY